MAPRLTRRPAGGLITVLAVFLLLASSGCSAGSEERVVEVGFYAFFEPVSSSAEADPTSPDFNVHVGYEADLLTAIEAMEGYGLRFNRTAVPQWTDIWLRPAGDEFDLAGGGITILESRTRDDAGEAVVAFTDGHIDFTQSLLVRAEDGPACPITRRSCPPMSWESSPIRPAKPGCSKSWGWRTRTGAWRPVPASRHQPVG
ncbi:MAG: amino acid ABC transporter substrate-binding protein [Acidimicrobiia bacterium]|nr:amino acid ABC transporter substrate-binding protein [Acidimicrobiia bacterium]